MSASKLEQPVRVTVSWAASLAQDGKRLLKIVVGWLLFVLVAVISVTLLNSYESHQPVDRDTPVWIQGDWLVGEYRICQMRTKTVPDPRKDIDSLDKLPRLFCGDDANGLFDFQRQFSPVSLPPDSKAPLPGAMYFISVTTDDLDSDFHVLSVRYLGSIQASSEKGFIYDYDRTDKLVISWRCQRNTESLTCKAQD